jgi:hypothetical protein
MLPLGATFRFLKALWPFLSEMFFEDKSLMDVVRANKLVVFMLMVLCLSLTINYFSVSKIFEIASSRREEREGAPPTPTVGKDSEKSAAPPDKAASQPTDQYEDTLQRLRRLEQQKGN